MRAVDANQWWVEHATHRGHTGALAELRTLMGGHLILRGSRATTYRRWPRGAAGQSRAGQERERG